jgi:hypothetical protein
MHGLRLTIVGSIIFLGACGGSTAPPFPEGVSLRADRTTDVVTPVPHPTELLVRNNTSATIVVAKCEVAETAGIVIVVGFSILKQAPGGHWSLLTEGVVPRPACGGPPRRDIGTTVPPGEEVSVMYGLVPPQAGSYRYTMSYFASPTSDDLSELTSPTLTVTEE